MNSEQTDVNLQEGSAEHVALKPDTDAAQAPAADLKQEQEEQEPITAGGGRAEDGPCAGGEEPEAGKNGFVNVKILDEEEKFSGLNKEELLRVAGTPGWVRTRWALLLVFWLGWLGMLVGAVLIILQAPPCRKLPDTAWWNEGPLYQIGNIWAFPDTESPKGLEQKINILSELNIKGLVVGPVHVAPPDDAVNLSFEEISQDVGNLDQFKGLIGSAHRKGISVVLDLTPNYRGSSGQWFSKNIMTNVAERLKSALVFWLNKGVDGFQLSGVEQVSRTVPSLWTDIRAIIQNGTEKDPKHKVLIGVTESFSAEKVSDLLSSAGVDLLISNVLSSTDTPDAESLQLMSSSHSQTRLAWRRAGRHASALDQLLLLTLPGTPVFPHDTIDLLDQEQTEHGPCRDFFRSASELRVKERSLLYGDFQIVSNSSSSLAYLRVWDQSDRYLAAFNWAAEEDLVLDLSHAAVPQHATVVLSTNCTVLQQESSVDLQNLQLGPGQATLIKFPYTG